MTSHRSSISSSDARRYVASFGLAAVLLLGTLGGISAVSYRFGLIDVATRWIYDNQVAKIENASQINIVFVGDSSLGNAIDAELVTRLSGRPTANLALSGTYGLGASFNMIRRAAERHDVQSAVIMQALNTMTRPDTVAGYFFTTNRLEWSELSPIELAKLYFNYRTAKETIQQVRRRGFKREAPEMEGDYIAQLSSAKGRVNPDEELEENPLLPGMVAQAEIDFVVRIAEYCESEGLRCVYAHGPIYEGYCDVAAPYIESLNEAITNAGLRVAKGTPRCMRREEVGNAIDHVIPSMKADYSRWYFERLRPYLEDEIATAP